MPMKDDAATNYTRAVLKEWTEIRNEPDTVERIYAKLAQAWPLEGKTQFQDNMKEATKTLRDACNYLHQTMHLMENASVSRAEFSKVQELAGTMNAVVNKITQLNGQSRDLCMKIKDL